MFLIKIVLSTLSILSITEFPIQLKVWITFVRGIIIISVGYRLSREESTISGEVEWNTERNVKKD